MYSYELRALRHELFEKDCEIAKIQKNHHLEGKEKEEALQQLAELLKEREDIKNRLRHLMYEYRDIEQQHRGGRI